MSIANRLKNLAFQQDPPDEPPPPPVRASGTLTYRRPPVTVPGYYPPQTAEDPEMAAEIESALAKCQTKGYKELLTQMEVLTVAVPNEDARVSAAVATVGALLQLTPAQLKASVGERIETLQHHRDTFNVGLRTEITETTQRYSSSLDAAQKRIAEIEAELTRLRRDAAEFERELSMVEGKSAEAQASYTATYNRFDEELSHLLQRIR